MIGVLLLLLISYYEVSSFGSELVRSEIWKLGDESGSNARVSGNKPGCKR